MVHFDALFNTTLLTHAQWHPEADVRGTFTILSSCLSTLALCVWSTLHLNIPEQGKVHQQKWRKLGWLVVGMFAPEIVLWNAFEQRRLVKALTAEMHRLHGARQNRPPSLRAREFKQQLKRSWVKARDWFRNAARSMLVCLLLRPGELPYEDYGPKEEPKEGHDAGDHFWSDTHSWYALMGGYVLEPTLSSTSAYQPYLPHGRQSRQRLVLTTVGVRMLYTHWPNLLPDISKQEIRDKSKADGLAKFLVCMQCIWFCIQCLLRWSQRLDMSLLEVNVLAHATCSLLCFLFWWNKPKDITESSQIAGQDAHAVGALMYTLSDVGTYECRGEPVPYQCNIPDRFTWEACEQTEEMLHFPASLEVAVLPMRHLMSPGGLKIADRCWRIKQNFPPEIFKEHKTVPVTRRLVAQLTAIQHFDEMHQIREELKWCDRVFSRPELTNDARCQLSVWRSHNISVMGKSFAAAITLSPLQYLTGCTFAGAVYGGIHLTAWHATFPSILEQTLWHLTVAILSLSGPIVALEMLCGTIANKLWTKVCPNTRFVAGTKTLLYARNPEGPFRPVKAIYLFIARVAIIAWSLVMVLLVLCRIYPVVESFRAVAYLSGSVLQTPSAGSYIPHIA